MKQLFEMAYQKYPEEPIKKKDLIEIIKDEDSLFPYFDFEKKADQGSFGKKLTKFYGRVFSDIRLNVIKADRAPRDKLLFTKQKQPEHFEVGMVGMVGIQNTPSSYKNTTLYNTTDVKEEKKVLDSLQPYQPYQESEIPVEIDEKNGMVENETQIKTIKKQPNCKFCQSETEEVITDLSKKQNQKLIRCKGCKAILGKLPINAVKYQKEESKRIGEQIIKEFEESVPTATKELTYVSDGKNISCGTSVKLYPKCNGETEFRKTMKGKQYLCKDYAHCGGIAK